MQKSLLRLCKKNFSIVVRTEPVLKISKASSITTTPSNLMTSHGKKLFLEMPEKYGYRVRILFFAWRKKYAC